MQLLVDDLSYDYFYQNTMKIQVRKYQATGNDFIIIDNRNGLFPASNSNLIQRLCHRRFGIGADGIILLEDAEKADFTMLYFNADGSLGSFCGNGSRCIVHFSKSLGVINDKCTFQAYDGIHVAEIEGNLVRLKMADVQNGRTLVRGTVIDTGSPHYVEFVNNLDELDVVNDGRSLRYNPVFGPQGMNINYVEKVAKGEIRVRTYERGVENETYSCGTGSTASAIAAALQEMGNEFSIITKGGNLKVQLEKSDEGFSNIWLEGPAENVFTCEIEI